MELIENHDNNSSHETQNSNTEIDKPLYVMTVEYEKGHSENIRIYENSKPDELAYDFCKKHNLDFSSLGFLSSQIKGLFASLPSHHVYTPKKMSNECIMEVDEEDGQNSELRGPNSNSNTQKEKSHTNSNVHVLYTDDYDNMNSNQSKEKDEDNNVIKSDSEVNSSPRDENDNNINNNNNNNIIDIERRVSEIQSNSSYLRENLNKVPQQQQEQSYSLFSYKDFFNRFKQSLIDKKKNNISVNNTQTFLDNSKSNNSEYKIINNKASINLVNKTFDTRLTQKRLSEKFYPKMTISKNTTMLENFFSKCANLDEIYQNRIKDITAFTNKSDNKTTGIIINAPPFHSTINEIMSPEYNKNKNNINIKINNINSNNNTNNNLYNTSLFKTKTPILTKNLKSPTFGDRLYHKGMLMREKVNSKISAMRNQIERNSNREITFKPLINHLSQKEIQKRMSQTKTIEKVYKKDINKKNPFVRYPSADTQRYSNYKRRSISSRQKDNKELSRSIGGIAKDESEILYNRKKDIIFKKIFNLLDSDNDKSINILSMETQRFPITIINIIQPIIDQVKQRGNDFKESEFIERCRKLFNSLSFNDKRALLNFGLKI